MSGEVIYTVTDADTGEVTLVPVEEAPVVEVVEYVCNKCEKQYKGLRCLQKHMMVCGLPKAKKKAVAVKRKSDEESSSTSSPSKASDDDVSLAAFSKRKNLASDVKQVPKIEETSESVAIEVIPVADEEEATEELCYCCDEPLENGHVRILIF